jgi:hypothetical protein
VLFLRKLQARCVSVDLCISSPQPSPRTRLSLYSNSSRGEGADRGKLKESLTSINNGRFFGPLGLGSTERKELMLMYEFQIKKVLNLIVLMLFSVSAYSWNSVGHQLIARLALAQLTSNEISILDSYNNAYHFGFQPKNLVQSSAWLDWIHCHEPNCKEFSHYHYIDYPYSTDGSHTLPPHSVNAVTAIEHAMQVLKNNHATDEEKGLQLRILLHVVGDIHQPMHAVSLFSNEFPQGDRGGNEYLLGQNRIAKNLHAYWDRGGGFLVRKSMYRHKGIHNTIRRLQKKYPCIYQQMTLSPEKWAKESYALAIKEAYQLPLKEKPSRQYQKMVKTRSEQRLTLAACRLSAALKAGLHLRD